MSVKILKISQANDAQWDEIWQACEYSTYFHSREWAQIWNIYTQGKIYPMPVMVSFSDGTNALIPLSFQKIAWGLIKEGLSSPAGTFGGWISTDNLELNHGILLKDYLLNTIKNIAWRVNPYDELALNVTQNLGNSDTTDVLNLRDGFDVLFKRWSKGHQAASKQAISNEVLVRKAETIADWQEYYRVYQDSIRRWGKNVSLKYSWKLFATIFNMHSKNVQLWLATKNNKIIAGALCFYSRKHIVYWHGAALKECFTLRPVNLLLSTIINDGCDKDYKYFDFNPSGGHEGVKNFKKSFGTINLSCPVISQNSGILSLRKKK